MFKPSATMEYRKMLVTGACIGLSVAQELMRVRHQAEIAMNCDRNITIATECLLCVVAGGRVSARKLCGATARRYRNSVLSRGLDADPICTQLRNFRAPCPQARYRQPLDGLSHDAHFLLGWIKAGIDFVAADMPRANRLTAARLRRSPNHWLG
jgi:hypothetical protein